MQDDSKTVSLVDRFGPLAILLSLVFAIVALVAQSQSSVVLFVTDRNFLLGFVFYVLQAVVVSLVAGGSGVLAGILISRSKILAVLCARIFRIGMWLPVFLFWQSPIFEMGNIPMTSLFLWCVTNIVISGIAVGPTVLLGACYYRLSCRQTQNHSNCSQSVFLARRIFTLALVLCLTWQPFLANPWPWGWMNTDPLGRAAWAAAVLIATLSVGVELAFKGRLDMKFETDEAFPAGLPDSAKARSGFALFVVLSLPLVGWLLWGETFKFLFSIDSPLSVARAMGDLLFAGDARLYKNSSVIWFDVSTSLIEIAGGAVLAVLGALFLTQLVVNRLRLQKYQWLLAAFSVAPIALIVPIIILTGVGIFNKILVVGCFALFPIAESMLRGRQASSFHCLVKALDVGLPYAFTGMLLGEAYASTAGLGFLILIAGAQGYIAGANAVALITFALLFLISSALRFFLNQLASRGNISYGN